MHEEGSLLASVCFIACFELLAGALMSANVDFYLFICLFCALYILDNNNRWKTLSPLESIIWRSENSKQALMILINSIENYYPASSLDSHSMKPSSSSGILLCVSSVSTRCHMNHQSSYRLSTAVYYITYNALQQGCLIGSGLPSCSQSPGLLVREGVTVTSDSCGLSGALIGTTVYTSQELHGNKWGNMKQPYHPEW